MADVKTFTTTNYDKKRQTVFVGVLMHCLYLYMWHFLFINNKYDQNESHAKNNSTS